MNKKTAFIFGLILILGSIVRLYNPAFRSLWGDEGHSFYQSYNLMLHFGIDGNIMQKFILPVSTFSVNIIKDSHLPLYFILLSGWMYNLGLSEYLLRMFSAIFGILSIVMIFKISRELFDDETALLASFLLSISPFAVFMTQEIRMYSVELFLSLCSFYFFWKILFTGKRKIHYLGYAIFTIALCLTHVYAILIFFSQIVLSVYHFVKRNNYYSLLKLSIAQAAPMVLLAPFYIKLFLNGFGPLMSVNHDMAYSVFPPYVKFILLFFVFSFGETVAPWNFLVTIPAGLFFAFLLIKILFKSLDAKIKYLFVLMLIPCILAALIRSTMPKYLIAVLPFYIILASMSILQLRAKAAKYGAVIFVCIIFAYSNFNYFALAQYHNSNQIEPWREVAGLIKREYKKSDVILYTNRTIIHDLLKYYLVLTDLGKDKQSSENSYENPYAFVLADDVLSDKKSNIFKSQRIWLVTHIADDRNYTPGAVKRIEYQISERYKSIKKMQFVPYESTLVSKIPIKRHRSGTSRISLSLFVSK